VLVEKKGEKHSPESLKKLLNDMYKLFENLLGQNMVKALPEDKREEYLRLCEDLNQLSYEKIAEIFDRHVPNYREVMKETMKQFADLFMRNRNFDPQEFEQRIKELKEEEEDDDKERSE
jgi:DNA-directed RNA polymerase specialized sigma24 family protein